MRVSVDPILWEIEKLHLYTSLLQIADCTVVIHGVEASFGRDYQLRDFGQVR